MLVWGVLALVMWAECHPTSARLWSEVVLHSYDPNTISHVSKPIHFHSHSACNLRSHEPGNATQDSGTSSLHD